MEAHWQIALAKVFFSINKKREIKMRGKGLCHSATDEMQAGCGNGLVSVRMDLSSQGNEGNNSWEIGEQEWEDFFQLQTEQHGGI